MKTRTKEKKEKSVIEQLRDIRDKISLEIKDLSYEELRQYFDRQATLYPTSAWRKAGRQK